MVRFVGAEAGEPVKSEQNGCEPRGRAGGAPSADQTGDHERVGVAQVTVKLPGLREKFQERVQALAEQLEEGGSSGRSARRKGRDPETQ